MLAAFFLLKPIFFNRKINEKIKILAYKQIIKPIAMYACSIWLQVSKPQIEKIAILERKILRARTGIYRRPDSIKYFRNTTLYEKSRINPIYKDLIDYSLKFLNKLIEENFASLNNFQHQNLHYYNSKPPSYIYSQRNSLFNNNHVIYYDNLPTLNEYRISQRN